MEKVGVAAELTDTIDEEDADALISGVPDFLGDELTDAVTSTEILAFPVLEISEENDGNTDIDALRDAVRDTLGVLLSSGDADAESLIKGEELVVDDADGVTLICAEALSVRDADTEMVTNAETDKVDDGIDDGLIVDEAACVIEIHALADTELLTLEEREIKADTVADSVAAPEAVERIEPKLEGDAVVVAELEILADVHVVTVADAQLVAVVELVGV